MAWRRPGDKALSEPMMVSLLTHICVTRLSKNPSLAVLHVSAMHLLPQFITWLLTSQAYWDCKPDFIMSVTGKIDPSIPCACTVCFESNKRPLSVIKIHIPALCPLKHSKNNHFEWCNNASASWEDDVTLMTLTALGEKKDWWVFASLYTYFKVWKIWYCILLWITILWLLVMWLACEFDKWLLPWNSWANCLTRDQKINLYSW